MSKCCWTCKFEKEGRCWFNPPVPISTENGIQYIRPLVDKSDICGHFDGTKEWKQELLDNILNSN